MSVADRLASIEARLDAIEKKKEPQILCLLDGVPANGQATYQVAAENIGGYECGRERFFPISKVLAALARKVGIRIVYHYPQGERVEFK